MASTQDNVNFPVGHIPDTLRADSGDDTSSSASSATSSKNPNVNLLSLNTRYTKFECYLKRFIKLRREVLRKDYGRHSLSARTLNADRYFGLRDRVCEWISRPDNATLFTDCDSYFYLAEMATAMRTIEIALALPHRSIDWPGAAPGSDPVWPGVAKGDVFQHFDLLVHGGCNLDTEAMPWNCK